MNTKRRYENKEINNVILFLEKFILMAGWIVRSLTEIGNNKRKDSLF